MVDSFRERIVGLDEGIENYNLGSINQKTEDYEFLKISYEKNTRCENC